MKSKLRHVAVIIVILLIALLVCLLFIAGYDDSVIALVFGGAAMILSLVCIMLFQEKGVK
jgi:hypothetical protein